MRRSEDRILTTHTGSLPRPADLMPLLLGMSASEPDGDGAHERVRDAVREAVRKQVAAGIDVVSDGPAEGAQVSLGDEATIGGFTFTLVDIVLDEKDSAPGGSGTTVWILPAE
jgi:methionine synthase II (cobalamin-independent)